ncbi:Wolbachia palindromic element domain protein [Wolbachia endosymbiont of Cylisticus convexus]|uniref:hypothetical protein n=1 Tax=Wolbachia endosymbiont of Cylisticus convexus TaxID=118728 RepID=UPI000E18F348|nr:hypothetical protein [Wolbachia endosymbiont of Cylisticus convexus]RDD34660.1 Wolbachia palindromic element domain protein [Wolbachia endosymbiont of Cylisticus convexus]
MKRWIPVSRTGMTRKGYSDDIMEAGIPVSATWITPKGLLAFLRHKSQCLYSCNNNLPTLKTSEKLAYRF